MIVEVLVPLICLICEFIFACCMAHVIFDMVAARLELADLYRLYRTLHYVVWH